MNHIKNAENLPLALFDVPHGRMVASLGPETARPVAILPSCDERVGLDGYQFPVLEDRLGHLLIAPRASQLETGWLDLAQVQKTYRINVRTFSQLQMGMALDVFWQNESVAIFSKPDEKYQIGNISFFDYIHGNRTGEMAMRRRQPGPVFKILAQKGDFVRIQYTAKDKSTHRVWIHLHRGKALDVWEGFFSEDDC